MSFSDAAEHMYGINKPGFLFVVVDETERFASIKPRISLSDSGYRAVELLLPSSARLGKAEIAL